MTVISILAILLFIMLAMTLLRLRVKFELDSDDRRLFMGLGRSGIEIDYLAKLQTIRVAGLAVKRQPIGAGSTVRPTEQEKEARAGKKEDSEDERSGPTLSSEMIRGLLNLAPKVIREVSGYSKALLSRIIVERLEADIRAGFDSPDMTGQTFGAYHAMIGAIPALAGHVRFTPDWQGASFEAAARGSLALPLYQILLHTPRLLWRLPLREIVRMAIGIKKGDKDGQ